jgi:hypothetical protein
VAVARREIEQGRPHRPAPEPADVEPASLAPNADLSRVLASLAGAPDGVRAQAVAGLQRGGGNAAIARALSPTTDPAVALALADEAAGSSASGLHTEVHRHAFSAEIQMGEPAGPRAPAPRAPAGAMRDSMKGDEHEAGPAEAAAAVGAPASAVAEAQGAAPAAPAAAEAPAAAASSAAAPPSEESAEQEKEEEFTLPDIKLEGAEEFSLCDKITPWLGYSGTVKTGAVPGATEFGVTWPGNMTLKGIKVRKIPMMARFLVSATLEQELKWGVRSGTGPTGEVNIGSILSSNLTQANHKQAASDLTPDPADLNGRPPRTQFWAQDITEQHEKFHADDCVSRGPGAVGVASTWLGTQAAADKAGVQTLLAEVPDRAFTAIMAAMAFPAREERAYGDGSGAYSRRVAGIKALGKIGAYP